MLKAGGGRKILLRRNNSESVDKERWDAMKREAAL